MKKLQHLALVILVLALSACTTLNVADPSALLASQGSSGPAPASGDANGRKLGSVIVPQQLGDFFVSTAASSPFLMKDTGGITRDTIETAHGRVTMGGGSDIPIVVGPLTGSETTIAGITVAGNNTLRALVNATGQLDLFGTGFDVGGAAWWLSANNTSVAFNSSAPSAASPFRVDYTTATTPLLQSGTSATSLSLGTNKAGATTTIQADAAANVLQLAGGTQNSVALGATLASAGHMRSPKGLQWLVRNGGGTGDNSLVYDDGADTLYIAQNGYTTLNVGGAATTSVNTLVSGTIEFSATTTALKLGTHFSEQYIFDISNTAKLHFQNVDTSATIVYDALSSAGAGNTLSIRGQDGNGTNNGGDLTLQAGAHAGAGTFEGVLNITGTPIAPGYLSITPSNGVNTLTTSQSDFNVIVLAAGATGAVTVNIARSVTKLTCVTLRNNTSQTVTVQFNGTSSATTLATLTGGYYCADGAAVQRILMLNPLDLPKPANDNGVPPWSAVAKKEAA